MINETKKSFLTELFNEAINSVAPKNYFRSYIPEPSKGRTIIIGAGKGVLGLATEFADHYKAAFESALVTQYDQCNIDRRFKVFFAGHPLPDQNGVLGTNEILRLTRGLRCEDLVIALFTGGGSALLPAPPPGFSLENEIELNQILLNAGLPISKMNLIRKHFSRIKGGRLATQIFPAQLKTFLISDIPNDVASQVASGPTIADTGSRKDALLLIKKCDLNFPKYFLNYLNSVAAEAPMPNNEMLRSNTSVILASGNMMLKGVEAFLNQTGIRVKLISADVQGEASQLGKTHAIEVLRIVEAGTCDYEPIILLSGGETTVKLGEKFGKGGRNTEYLLSLTLELDNKCKFSAFAADTDGIDGSEKNAGAFSDSSTIGKLRRLGLNPSELLKNHDTYTAFEAIKTLFFSGPTGTNVNDLRVIFINKKNEELFDEQSD